ncbi:PREDICTED: probable E3 ubiquitin ligase complex SCF subunit sconB [Priapulus caudatus]|uniref:Probable E3 ubiquitin ligase complex SCF subunit sconB n=1 Tax=Priapulus caudatus TaxID=37621 RepID=A0ABM1EVA3_PRICU|nr:PREDICTED: probable E3 ubiquitin ligase complex SCF subunit sconB [Priapulus caudatus]
MDLQVMLQWFTEFSENQKNLMLKKLLAKCGVSQMHLLSTCLEPVLHATCPPNCRDLLSWLPPNLTHHIFSYLDPASLCRASRVCKSWHQLSNESVFWRRNCHLPKWRLSSPCEQKQMIKYMRPDGTVQWKRVFAERYRLRRNWLTGHCNVRTFEGHTQGISCVQFDDTKVVSGSSDRTIKVWRLAEGACLMSLVGHQGAVTCLQYGARQIISGSLDCNIKFWDLTTGRCTATLDWMKSEGHTGVVRCLQADSWRILSAADDRTIKVWNLETGERLVILRISTVSL